MSKIAKFIDNLTLGDLKTLENSKTAEDLLPTPAELKEEAKRVKVKAKPWLYWIFTVAFAIGIALAPDWGWANVMHQYHEGFHSHENWFLLFNGVIVIYAMWAVLSALLYHGAMAKFFKVIHKRKTVALEDGKITRDERTVIAAAAFKKVAIVIVLYPLLSYLIWAILRYMVRGVPYGSVEIWGLEPLYELYLLAMATLLAWARSKRFDQEIRKSALHNYTRA